MPTPLTAGSANAKTADWASYHSIYFDVRATTGGGTSEPGSVSATAVLGEGDPQRQHYH